MERKLKPILVLLLAGFLSFTVKAQEEMTENDVPLIVLTWFYKNYGQAEEVKWSKTTRNDQSMLKASFQQNDKKVTSVYNMNGEIMEESVLDEKPVIPSEISDYTSTKFGKVKIMSLRKITKFSHVGTQEKDIFFELLCKQGSTVQSVWYDTQFNVQGDDDYSDLASN